MNNPASLSAEQRPTALYLVWAVSFGSLIAAFPFYSYLVFELGFERDSTADIFASHIALAYWIGILAPCLPITSLKSWSGFRKLQTICLTFMLVSYITHLSWELVWLILHDLISASKDEMWAYIWWAYIDGGDMRYADPEMHFMMIEILSVINGLIGFAGLTLLWRSGFTNPLGTLMCMSTGVTHTVLTWYYYGTEVLTGFASVNTASFMDLWVKFIFLNAPWLVFPWLVLIWGYRLLTAQLQGRQIQ